MAILASIIKKGIELRHKIRRSEKTPYSTRKKN